MPTVNYTNVGGQIISEKRGGNRSFYGADPLGSTVALYDSSGAVTDSFAYWPYGEVRTSTGSTATPFKFCGTWGYCGEASGRTYVRARFYRDKLGRWQTVDPLWPNELCYAYVANSPLAYIDPSGQQKAIADLPKNQSSEWSQFPISYYNNCYSYACDVMFPGNPVRPLPPGSGLPQPGGGRCDPCNCKSVMDAVAKDGFITPRPKGKKCPPGTFTVILFVRPTPTWDYHFARSLPNGKWCDKHGEFDICIEFDDPYEHNRVLGYTVVCQHYCGKVKR